MELKPISDQVVVIVGANSGIGRETALQMAEKGARVVLAGRSQAELDELAGIIQSKGGQATAMEIEDVARFDEMHKLAQHAVDVYGRIDTWVHTAGASLYARFEETMPEEFRRILEVNLLGQMYGALAALPHIKREGRGALIHLSSVEARRSLPYQAAYAASKQGIPGFLDSLRLELQKEGIPIAVTNIMPSGINTPFFDKALTRIGVKPQPMPPAYEPSVAADAIIHAATHPTRDFVVGGAGRSLGLLQKVSPALADRFMTATGFAAQRSDIPKSPNAPHNLYSHLSGLDQVEGSYDSMAKPYSMQTWLRAHPAVRRILMGGLLAGAAMFLFGRRYSRTHRLTAREMAGRLGDAKAVRGIGRRIGDVRHLPGAVGERVASASRVPARMIVPRRRIGPLTLPGRVGPIHTKGKIGPMTLPEHIGRVNLPEAIAGRKVGPFELPRVFAARTRR